MSKEPERYVQCLLTQDNKNRTAWIPVRGAKVGARVELLPSRELWTVDKVYEHGLPADVLRELQSLNRDSLPSVERTQ